MAKKPPPRFVLLGAAGYVAPRHMAAIKAVGGELVAAVDPCDSVGVLDRYFPKCFFFKNHLDALDTVKADYAVICTPNNLHAVQAFQALEAGMDVIVEKPAAITTGRVEELIATEKHTGKRVNCILNMRLHHDAQILKAMVSQLEVARFGAHSIVLPDVYIQYHTPRGPWYWESWKADKTKSGGILFNIGIHLIDLAIWVFGKSFSEKAIISKDNALIKLELERTTVFANLSINGKKRQRTFSVGDAEFDFTNGFEDLHVESYRKILAGNGFTLEDARPAIELCERLTKACQ